MVTSAYLKNAVAEQKFCFSKRRAKPLRWTGDDSAPTVGWKSEAGFVIGYKTIHNPALEYLPTLFDFKLLIGILSRARGDPNVEFSSTHALLKELGLVAEKTRPSSDYYDLVDNALLRWRYLTFSRLFHNNESPPQDKSRVWIRVINSFSTDKRVRIRLSEKFLACSKVPQAAQIDPKIINCLTSAHAATLYCFLRAFHLSVINQSLNRNIKKISNQLFCHQHIAPSQSVRAIESALTNINSALCNSSRGRPPISYEVTRNGKFISFNKGERTPQDEDEASYNEYANKQYLRAAEIGSRGNPVGFQQQISETKIFSNQRLRIERMGETLVEGLVDVVWRGKPMEADLIDNFGEEFCYRHQENDEIWLITRGRS